MKPYADSRYAHDRWCVKCDHCREEFELTEDPKPCIERIAEALESLRSKVPR